MICCEGCGALLDSPRGAACRSCGRVRWGNAKPCAAALVTRSGRVLLVRRAHSPWEGMWCAPSGFCDGPEHPIAAAEREVREETGIDARVTAYVGTWISPYTDGPARGESEYVSVQYYLAEPTEPEAALDGGHDPEEVSELGWFGPDALPTPLAAPGALECVLDVWRGALAAGSVAPLGDRPGGRHDPELHAP